MYICISCGETFEEPREVINDYGYIGSAPVRERERVCPYCGEQYEEAETCENCGEHISEAQHKKSGLCKDCETALVIRFNALLRENFTEKEIEILNAEFDGEYFGE